MYYMNGEHNFVAWYHIVYEVYSYNWFIYVFDLGVMGGEKVKLYNFKRGFLWQDRKINITQVDYRMQDIFSTTGQKTNH